MINNLITHLKEEASEDAEHKIWCDTELTTNARPQLKIWMENLAMEVAELSAQVSRLREEVSNANLIRHEETATNEEAIKDVQDAEGWSGPFISRFPKPGPSKDLQQKSGGWY